MTRRFTGWHMLAVLTGMFGTIITVNVVMATYAATTFGGTVVENSYVASQHFNDWLAAARRQRRHGWTARIDIGANRHVDVDLASPTPVENAVVTATAVHPLGRAPEQDLRFVRVGPSLFRSTQPLRDGRWLLHVAVVADGAEARFVHDVAP